MTNLDLLIYMYLKLVKMMNMLVKMTNTIVNMDQLTVVIWKMRLTNLY
jgi:hypothetical protein